MIPTTRTISRQRRASSLAPLLILLVTAVSPAFAAGGDVIFAEGFERGDTSGWTVWRPPPGTTWQWQLSGTIDTSFAVVAYDVDLADTPQATIDGLHTLGRKVICYFSAGSWEDYRDDAGDFPAVVLGASLDPPFTDERWLDIRRMDLLGPIMEARLDVAVAKGCDAVEPDNVDGFDNATGFPLSAADQLAYNRYIAAAAHERQLSVGLKNDLAQIVDLVDDFDWAINEQCWEFSECDDLLPFIEQGKAVFGVEYSGDPAVYCPALNALCYSWLGKNIELDAARLDCQTFR